MIFLLENRAQDLMTLLIYHHPEERKQTRIPKDKEGVSGISQKTFLSPNGYPKPSPLQLHRMQLVQNVQITRQKLHSNVAPAKTNSRYRNTSSPVQNCLHPPVKIRKHQSQNNHDSFNCGPSKSNPHSINQKSVIFGMHKNTSSERLQHKCHIAP